MSVERVVPCQFNPTIKCEAECDLYEKGFLFISSLESRLSLPEGAVVERLRDDFFTLTPNEQEKIITTKMIILEQKGTDPSTCTNFETIMDIE